MKKKKKCSKFPVMKLDIFHIKPNPPKERKASI